MANSNFKVRTGLSIGENVSISDTGAVTGLTFTELNVDNININGNTITSTNTNGDIILQPNGTGDVDLVADTVVVGDANAAATITTNGTGDLILNTNAGTNAGTITLANGSNGNITLAPNGNGDVVLTLGNGGNLINNRNYVFGSIRNSTTESNGDIWALNATGNVLPARGISIDNSLDTTRTAMVVARTYSSTAAGRSRLIFERARGTAGNVTAVLNGDFLGEVAVTGTNGTNTWLNDSTSVVPGFFGFTAAENWSSNTALGTNFSLSLAPTATTITSAANLVTCITVNPQTAIYRSDAFTFRQGKTGTADSMTIDVNGNVAITGDLRVNGNDIRSSGNTSQITMSSAGATLELRGDNIQLENAAGTSIVGSNITYNRVYGQWEQDGPVNPVAANTSYVFPIGNAVDTNIASVVSTSRITPGAAGKYNLQFSLQWANGNNSEHTFYVWLRKNGVNVANSTGDVTCLKSAKGITGWNYIISSANATDYWELAYQVNNTAVTFPYVAGFGTAPNDVPSCPALITTITPVGA